MTLVIDTTAGNSFHEDIRALLSVRNEAFDIVNTSRMNIAHCRGCNNCFLKTPGICAIKDDYEAVLKKLAHSDNLWLVTGVSFGFIDSRGKKVMDRILPLLNMYLCFRDGEMRHTLRYDRPLNVGVLYDGKADAALLEFWCRRASSNLGGHSLGAYPVENVKEALA